MDWKLDSLPGVKKQPAPQPNGHKPVWEMVIEDMQERDRVGRKQYGVPLQPFNGRDALVETYQEALDMCVYLRQVISERDAVLELSKPPVAYETIGQIFGSFLEACLAADEYAVLNAEKVSVFVIDGDGRHIVYISDGVAAQEEMREESPCVRIKLR